MAITDTTAPPQTASSDVEARPEATGLAELLGTGDHKAIGLAFIVVSLVFGLVALVGAGLSQLNTVGTDPMLSEAVGLQVFTLSSAALVLLFAIPLFLGLGIYLTPLQVGAATIAFPRAAALSLWAWLGGSALLAVSYAIGGGPGGTSVQAVDLSYLAMLLVISALLLGSVCVATTVIGLRADGMDLSRVPLFSWGMLVASGAWLLSLPVLMGNILLIDLDVRHGQLSFGSLDTNPWMQLGWAFLLPTVYLCAIPVLGALGDIIPTIADVRSEHRGLVMFSLGLFGALALGAWAQPAQGGSVWTEPLFVGVNVAFAVPLLGCLGAWLLTLKQGATKVAAPIAIGLCAMVLLLVAALAGGVFGVGRLRAPTVLIPGYDVPVGAVGQANLVVAAAVAGALAALFFWGPKLTGRTLSEGIGKLVAPVVLFSGLAWGVPLIVAGYQARFTGLADADDAFASLSAIGAAGMVLAVVLALLALLGSSRGEHAADDAWGSGQTLEWATSCPPPRANFGALPLVTSPEPLLDAAKEA